MASEEKESTRTRANEHYDDVQITGTFGVGSFKGQHSLRVPCRERFSSVVVSCIFTFGVSSRLRRSLGYFRRSRGVADPGNVVKQGKHFSFYHELKFHKRSSFPLPCAVYRSGFARRRRLVDEDEHVCATMCQAPIHCRIIRRMPQDTYQRSASHKLAVIRT